MTRPNALFLQKHIDRRFAIEDDLVLNEILMQCCDVINEMQGPLVEHCKTTLKSFYGDDPQTSDCFGRMVNNRHFKYVMILGSCLCLYISVTQHNVGLFAIRFVADGIVVLVASPAFPACYTTH